MRAHILYEVAVGSPDSSNTRPAGPDPFAGCCWPGCERLPHKSDFFCPVHEHQVPKAIGTAMHGAVVEGNQQGWRAAVDQLRALSTG